jgi:hypothetical protein
MASLGIFSQSSFLLLVALPPTGTPELVHSPLHLASNAKKLATSALATLLTLKKCPGIHPEARGEGADLVYIELPTAG